MLSILLKNLILLYALIFIFMVQA